jgi:ABC-type Mn2+/Zn2+ transport system permease subunit
LIAALQSLTDPWSEPIMRRAALECLLLAWSGGLLGCWLVLYRLSYATESLAHGLLPGLVAATLLGAPLLLGGAVGLVVAAGAVAAAARVPLVSRDSAVAVTVTTLFGLGIVLALSPDSPPGIQNLLFGDILGVSDSDLLWAAVLAAVLACALPVLHHRLLSAGFDRDSSAAMGLRPGLTEAALLVLLAAALLVAVQGMGNLLVVAVLIAPAAAAAAITDRIGAMMAASVALAVLGCLGGLYLSYYAATAAGASIAAVLATVFVFSRLVVSR